MVSNSKLKKGKSTAPQDSKRFPRLDQDPGNSFDTVLNIKYANEFKMQSYMIEPPCAQKIPTNCWGWACRENTGDKTLPDSVETIIHLLQKEHNCAFHKTNEASETDDFILWKDNDDITPSHISVRLTTHELAERLNGLGFEFNAGDKQEIYNMGPLKNPNKDYVWSSYMGMGYGAIVHSWNGFESINNSWTLLCGIKKTN